MRNLLFSFMFMTSSHRMIIYRHEISIHRAISPCMHACIHKIHMQKPSMQCIIYTATKLCTEGSLVRNLLFTFMFMTSSHWMPNMQEVSIIKLACGCMAIRLVGYIVRLLSEVFQGYRYRVDKSTKFCIKVLQDLLINIRRGAA